MNSIKYIAVFGALISAAEASAETVNNAFENEEVDRVVTFGRAEKKIGNADSASEGLVGYDDFTTRPLLRVGELVEVIPGMVATQHSGSGKANQYFLRGFNLDHGTDFLASFEGMPINLPTHGHGQGYLDLNFIIPEVVRTVEYQKGPYNPEIGDFSSAGATNFNIYDSLDENFAEIMYGQNGYYRFVTGNSVKMSDGDLLLALEGQLNDGPWVLDDDLKKINSILKYTHTRGDVSYSLLATGYHSTWNSTDQVPSRAIQSGLIDRLGYLDDDLGGETTRITFSGKAKSENLEAMLYGQYYDFNLFSNFTYFLDDPINGDEFEQLDNRSIWGGEIKYNDVLRSEWSDIEWTTGASFRYDRVNEVGLYKTASRQRLQAIRNDRVDELSISAFGNLKFLVSDKFRFSTGVRIDRLSYDVEALRGVNSGSGNDIIVSPKFSSAYRLAETIEVYANYGNGFHTNDVRGATISIDPVSGDAVSTVPVFAKSQGAEVGLRYEPTENVNTTISVFWLDLDSELVFVGDAGTTEVNDGSRRYGVEFSGFWQANEWLSFDVSVASTDAKFNLAQDRYIPGSVRSVFAAGSTVTLANGITGSIRVRHFGSAPLIEDNSVRSEPTTLVNFGLKYEFDMYAIDLDVFNLFDSKANDITYLYESQLQGEASAVNDIHYHPVEPLTFRLGLRIKY